MLQLIAQSQFGQGLTSPSEYLSTSGSSGEAALTNLELLISNLIGLLTVLGGLFFVFFFVQGALSWITAGGDSGKIEKARNQMVQGVIGLVILVASYAIIGLIGTIVGINLLSPAETLQNLVPNAGTSPSTFSECINLGNTPAECNALR